ncbi:MAG: efflux RND transporter periplasmic adaptor subunit [Terriglobales bacterium]
MSSRPGSTLPDLSPLKIDERARASGGRRKFLPWFAAVLGAVLLVSALVIVLQRQAPLVEVAVARTSGDNDRVALLNASGYVTPRRRATVAAKITARVTRMNAEEGMRVQQGQVLALLDDSDARVRLNSAIADRDATSAALQDLEVNLANADRELHRTQALETGGVASPQALDLARTTADSYRARIALAKEQIRAADARIKVAQQDLDNCTVRSPFDGIVVSKDAQVGEMVSPISAGGGFTRTGIATVVDMNSLEIEVDVNESYIARVASGQPVAATLDAYPDWKIPCKVRTVIPTADRQKATVKVRISFDKLDPRILPDMGVKVAFLSDEPAAKQTAARQVVVPKSAVRDEGGQQAVFIYKDGRVERRAIRAGGTRGEDQVVLAGVSDGDQVVVGGAERLHDGSRVGIKK